MSSPDAKPLLRPRTIALTVLVLLLLWAGAFILKIATLAPGTPGKFNAVLQRSVEEAQAATAGEPNAWPEFLRVIALYDSLPDPAVLAPKPADWPEGLAWPPTPDEAAAPNATEAARALFRRRLAQLDEGGLPQALDALAAQKRFVRPIGPGRLLDVQLPELSKARAIARVAKARLFFAAADGDQAAFLRAATHALTLAHILKRQSTIIDHLVGGAVDSMITACIREALLDGRLAPQTCRDLLALLDAHALKIDTVRGLKGEHLFAQDTVEWTHTDDGHGDGYLIPSLAFSLASGPPAPSTIPAPIANFATILAPSKAETLEQFEQYYLLGQDYAATPLRRRTGLRNPDTFVDSLSRRNFMVRTLLPALGQYIRNADSVDVEIAGTKVMLALELHRAGHGDHPASLEALDPALLHIDPQWRPELRYSLTPQGPRPYQLYWIGFDGVDNLATPLPKTERWSPLSTGKPGFDFLFTLPTSPQSPPSTPASSPALTPAQPVVAPGGGPPSGPSPAGAGGIEVPSGPRTR